MMKSIFIILVLFCCTSMHGQDLAFTEVPNVKLKQESHQHLSIFPNPTTDFFGVKHDKDIRKVVVYNWIGKKIQSFNHSKGNMYNVENLDAGIYIVRLFDEHDKLQKVLRLHRN